MERERDRGEGASADEPEALVVEHVDPGLRAADANADWSAAIDDLETMPFGGGSWKPVGPEPLLVRGEQIFQGVGPNSGEVVDIAIDPSGGVPKIYSATGSGGLWKSIDGGLTWRALTDGLPTGSVGAVALDPGDPNVVYAGTGNSYEGGANIRKGKGLFKSVDGGASWSPMDGGHLASPFGDQGINRIACPLPNVVLVGTSRGLFLSTNGGVTFGANTPACDDGATLRNGFISSLVVDTGAFTTKRVEAVETSGDGLNLVLRVPSHGFLDGDRVYVGAPGNLVINGSFTARYVDDDRFILAGVGPTGPGPVTAFVIGPVHANSTNITGAASSAGAASPIRITAAAHALITGDIVAIHGVGGATNANVSAEIRVIDDNTFDLLGTRLNAAYTNGGVVDGPIHRPAKAITAATTGALRITSANHRLVDGDRVTLEGLPGIAAPSNSGIVTRINDNEFRVAGLTMSGAYGGAGAAFRGPAAAFNHVYVAVAGREPPTSTTTQAHRGLFRLAMTSDGGFALSENLLSHTGGPTNQFARIVVAQSTLPRDRTLYAGVQNGEFGTGSLVGLFRSTDYGKTWSGQPGIQLRTRQTTDGFGQTPYDFTLGIDPQDPNRVYAAFQQLWRSDGGTAWATVTPLTGGGDSPGDLATSGNSPSTCNLHWDHHELTFELCTHWAWNANDPVAPTPFYVGTDGGIARANAIPAAGVAGPITFTSLNEGLATSLLIGIDIGRGDGDNAATFGGMQDTGTAGHRGEDAARSWVEGIDGDGGPVAVDSFNPNIVYGFDNGMFMRSTNGGDSWFRTGIDDQPVVLQVFNETPIRIETTGHALRTGDTVNVSGVRHNGVIVAAGVNGSRTVTVAAGNTTELTLNGTTGATMAAFDRGPRATGGRYLHGRRILGASFATPIEIQTDGSHGFTTGQRVRIEGVVANTNANNTSARPSWVITVTAPDRFTLDGSTPSIVGSGGAGTGRVFGPRVDGTVPIQLVTNATPMVVTAVGHGFATGENVAIEGVLRAGNQASAANGPTRAITVIDSNSFRLDGVATDGAVVAGVRVRGGGVGRVGGGTLPTGTFSRVALVPDPAAASTRVYVIVDRQLFRSNDAGLRFQLMHTFVDRVSAIAAPALDQLWIGKTGTSGPPIRRGAVEFSRDGGAHWLNHGTDHFVSTLPSFGPIYGFAIDPRDANHVVVVVAGYSRTHATRRTRHVFETTTGGRDNVAGTAAWTEIGGVTARASGNLPDIPILSAAFDATTTPATLLVATDGGVLRRDGDTWKRVGPNMPTTSCQSLAVDNTVSPSIVRVGTYGRSAWQLERPTAPRLEVRGSLGFGAVVTGTAARVPLLLCNAGTDELSISRIDFDTAGELAIKPAPTFPIQIAGGASLAAELELTPSLAGPRRNGITFTTNNPDHPNVNVSVSGIGVAAGRGRLAVRRRLGFGPTRSGTTVILPLILRNTGTGDIVVTVAPAAGGSAAFSLGPTAAALFPFPIGPGETLSVDIQFAPTTNGAATRDFQITSPSLANPVTVTMSGEGTTNAATLLAQVMNAFGLADAPDSAVV